MGRRGEEGGGEGLSSLLLPRVLRMGKFIITAMEEEGWNRRGAVTALGAEDSWS